VPDAKSGMRFRRRLDLFHPAHIGHHRSNAEPAGQFRELRWRSHSVDLHSPIVQISRVSDHTEPVPFPLREVPETDALYPPPDEIPSGDFLISAH
jgi:hypothetical protein